MVAKRLAADLYAFVNHRLWGVIGLIVVDGKLNTFTENERLRSYCGNSRCAGQGDDDRKTSLVYLDSNVIKELKMAALDKECNVYEIVEEAARDWLEKEKQDPRSLPACGSKF